MCCRVFLRANRADDAGCLRLYLLQVALVNACAIVCKLYIHSSLIVFPCFTCTDKLMHSIHTMNTLARMFHLQIGGCPRKIAHFVFGDKLCLQCVCV